VAYKSINKEAVQKKRIKKIKHCNIHEFLVIQF